MSKQIGLLGNGGQANETETYLDEDMKVIFRAVSPEYIDKSNPDLIDINEPGDLISVAVVASLGPPALRRKMVDEWPGKNYISVISKKAFVDKDCSVGEGSIIAPGSVITTDVSIGKHTIINIGATINHNCKIGNFVTISPGVNIAGNVEVDDGVFVGIGAVISNGVKIAPGVVIGAGAVVIKDVGEENSVIVGNPAKAIKVNQNWLNEI